MVLQFFFLYSPAQKFKNNINYVWFFFQINGPTWQVQLGRRDGRVSILSEAPKNLPTPFDNFTTLKTRFGALGLNVKDIVVLSGKIHFDLRDIVT